MVGGALPATPRPGQPDPLIHHFPRIRLYRFTHFPASSPFEESEVEVEVRRFGQVRVRREDHSFSPQYRSVLAELSHPGKCLPSHVKSTASSPSLSSHQHTFSSFTAVDQSLLFPFQLWLRLTDRRDRALTVCLGAVAFRVHLGPPQTGPVITAPLPIRPRHKASRKRRG